VLPGPTATSVVSATDSVCIIGSEQQCHADEPIHGDLAGRNVHSVCAGNAVDGTSSSAGIRTK